MAKAVVVSLPLETEYAAIPRQIAETLATRAKFTKSKLDEIKTALGEAIINVIKHAYDSNTENRELAKYRVRYLIYPDKLVIVVKDFGKGFNSDFVLAYVKRKEAKKPESAGMGIFLIRTLMDEVEFVSAIGEGTEVRMTKYLES
jgi:serine/threonine-protein kinase RsbW